MCFELYSSVTAGATSATAAPTWVPFPPHLLLLCEAVSHGWQCIWKSVAIGKEGAHVSPWLSLGKIVWFLVSEFEPL